MAAILNRIALSEIFGYDPGADLEFHLKSGVVNCGPLTISAYKKLAEEVDKIQEGLASITEGWRSNSIRLYGPMFLCRDKCYFFPTTSWIGQDVKDWFEHIGFTPVSPAAEFDDQLSGRLLLESDALKVFTEDDWTLLLEKYSAYCKRLKAHWPELEVKKLRKIHKKTELY